MQNMTRYQEEIRFNNDNAQKKRNQQNAELFILNNPLFTATIVKKYFSEEDGFDIKVTTSEELKLDAIEIQKDGKTVVKITHENKAVIIDPQNLDKRLHQDLIQRTLATMVDGAKAIGINDLIQLKPATPVSYDVYASFLNNYRGGQKISFKLAPNAPKEVVEHHQTKQPHQEEVGFNLSKRDIINNPDFIERIVERYFSKEQGFSYKLITSRQAQYGEQKLDAIEIQKDGKTVVKITHENKAVIIDPQNLDKESHQDLIQRTLATMVDGAKAIGINNLIQLKPATPVSYDVYASFLNNYRGGQKISFELAPDVPKEVVEHHQAKQPQYVEMGFNLSETQGNRNQQQASLNNNSDFLQIVQRHFPEEDDFDVKVITSSQNQYGEQETYCIIYDDKIVAKIFATENKAVILHQQIQDADFHHSLIEKTSATMIEAASNIGINVPIEIKYPRSTVVGQQASERAFPAQPPAQNYAQLRESRREADRAQGSKDTPEKTEPHSFNP